MRPGLSFTNSMNHEVWVTTPDSAFCPTGNKAVAPVGLDCSCENRGHKMTLLLKIQADLKKSTILSKQDHLLILLHVTLLRWLSWLSFGGSRLRLHIHTSTLAKYTACTVLCLQQLDSTKASTELRVEKLYTALARWIQVNERRKYFLANSA